MISKYPSRDFISSSRESIFRFVPKTSQVSDSTPPPQYPSLTIISIPLTYARLRFHDSTSLSPPTPNRLPHPNTNLARLHASRNRIFNSHTLLVPRTTHDSHLPHQSSHDRLPLLPSQNGRASLPIGAIARSPRRMRIASMQACMEGDVEACMEAHMTLFPVRRRTSSTRRRHVFFATVRCMLSEAFDPTGSSVAERYLNAARAACHQWCAGEWQGPSREDGWKHAWKPASSSSCVDAAFRSSGNHST
jgi:hypothetical protein